MSGSHREVRDIVKTADWSKVRFIHSCSTYRLAVLPFTVETIDDILTTSLIAPLLFLPLFPPPTSPLLRLPFLLTIFFSVFAFSFFFYFVVVFVLFRLSLFVLSSSVTGQICQPFQCSVWKVVAVAESKTWAISWITVDRSRSWYSKAPRNITMK